MNKKILLIFILLSACAVGPDYEKPAVDVPAHWPWENSAEKQEKQEFTMPLKWWEQFNEPVLSKLVDEGIANNSDLLIAAGRVAEARGILTANQANLYPELDLQGNATRESRSANSNFGGVTIGKSKPYNDFALSAVLNYELDIWGRLRRASESARAEVLSIEANRDAIRLVVASDIASGYFNLLALDAQIAVTQNTVKSREENYRYLSAQYKFGATTGLDFKQAEAEMASAKAVLPLLAQQREEQETALGVLLGRSPKDLIEKKIQIGKEIDALPSPPQIPSNLPSTLLERRPDVKSAEEDLKANNANIGIAVADYFPRISLSALLGLDSGTRNNFFERSSRTWQLGANIAGPIIDFGRVSGNVSAARGRKDQAFYNYMQVVRSAFKDTLDAMSAQNTTAERTKQQAIQVEARAEALRLANLRYNAGYTDYLTALDAERYLFQAQLDRITAKRDALNASVNLYKALGGGWGSSEALD